MSRRIELGVGLKLIAYQDQLDRARDLRAREATARSELIPVLMGIKQPIPFELAASDLDSSLAKALEHPARAYLPKDAEAALTGLHRAFDDENEQWTRFYLASESVEVWDRDDLKDALRMIFLREPHISGGSWETAPVPPLPGPPFDVFPQRAVSTENWRNAVNNLQKHLAEARVPEIRARALELAAARAKTIAALNKFTDARAEFFGGAL